MSNKQEESFLYVSGLSVTETIKLCENVEIIPACCDPSTDLIIKQSCSEIDLGIAAIFLRRVGAQVKISGVTGKELAAKAWNAQWDVVILSALFDCDAVANFQSDTPAELLSNNSHLSVTNYHMRGSVNSLYTITAEDVHWLNTHFQNARSLLDVDRFSDAVSARSSYRWHPNPRTQLAVLWSGIEGLFDIQGETVFKLSLFVAKFLEPDDKYQAKRILSSVKKLYKSRSSAVHGSKIKGDRSQLVSESSELLERLIRRCIEVGSIPDVEELTL
ncbi:HEPN domain-containing protein [Vibrio parahaemolyticus]|uniref:HEPN domain-containing protein n=1 Tax=Vibrio parahaemolyticus TaxID=670 RepID=UPI0022A8121A|nr:HEPN domain-containing protein [Vibrio parahaemolyticus]